MIFLATIFESIAEWWSTNDALANASGIINSGLVTGGLIFYNKVVAPKLMALKSQSAEMGKVLGIVDHLNAKFEDALGVNLELKKDLYILRDAFNIAYTNSNLDQQSKALLQEVLNGVMTGEKVEIRDNMSEMEKASKAAVQDMMNKAKELANENKRTAIQALQAKIAEATMSLAPKTNPQTLINSAEATKQHNS